MRSTITVAVDLSQIQKHTMRKNGTFSFDIQIPNSQCCCRHSTAEHLDCFSTCLVPGCLCYEFLEEGYKASDTVLTRRGTVKKEKKILGRTQALGQEVSDARLDKYMTLVILRVI
jgi:hypothetical protein